MSTSTPPVRFAYVGCGFVAQSIHIPNFHALPECDFVALAEVRRDLGAAVARRYGIRKVYRSHEEIANDPEIEAVGVSAPYALQGRIAEDLARAGKQVFMEKPMAINVARAERIVAAQKQGGRIFVAYMKRYDGGNRLLKKQLDAWRATGEAGRLMLARNHGFGGNWVYAQDPNVPILNDPAPAPPPPEDYPDWLPARWHDAYVNYLQQWTHNANLLRFLLADASNPSPPAIVKSVQLDADGHTGLVVLEINGVRAVIESGYTRFHAWDEHTQVYFQGGHLRTEAPALMHKQTPATCEVYRAGQSDCPPSLTQQFAPPAWSYREEAAAFLRCVRSGEPFASSADDTLHDVRLMEDIYRQFVQQHA
jgi:predicted dehydrogenase